MEPCLRRGDGLSSVTKVVMRSSQVADFTARLPAAGTRRSPLRKLYVQVLIAIAVGILLGALYPSVAVEMKPISDGFIMLIRSVVPLVIFVTVAVGIAKMGDMRRVGIVGVRHRLFRSGVEPGAAGRARGR